MIHDKDVFCLHAVSDETPNIFKNGGHQRRKRRLGLDQAEREKAASHLGDIRSAVREQSRPTGGTKQESGAELSQTGWPLRLEVYVPQSRTPVEKGHWGAGWAFWAVCLSAVSLSETCIPLIVFTHWLFLCVLFVSCTSSSIVFYLVSLCFFLFAVSFFLFSPDHHHHNVPLPPPLLSSCRPSLLPSILQMLVGSRTISRGSWWPAAPSLWSFPAIVPGPTAAWLLHSINHTHNNHRCTLTVLLGPPSWEEHWRLENIHESRIPWEICGEFQRYSIMVHMWLDRLNVSRVAV